MLATLALLACADSERVEDSFEQRLQEQHTFLESLYDRWRYSRSVDPMTDDTSHVAAVHRRGPSGQSPALLLRCQPGAEDPQAYFAPAEYIGASGSVDVRWRFDTAEPSSTDGSLSRSGDAVFMPSYRVRTFARSLRSSRESVLMEVEDFRGVPIRVRFPLENVDAALDSLPCLESASGTSRNRP